MCVKLCEQLRFSFIVKVEGTAEWAGEERTQTFAGSVVCIQGHANDFFVRHLEQNFGQERFGQQHLCDVTKHPREVCSSDTIRRLDRSASMCRG